MRVRTRIEVPTCRSSPMALSVQCNLPEATPGEPEDDGERAEREGGALAGTHSPRRGLCSRVRVQVQHPD